MDYPKWAKDDGEKLADIIYEKLTKEGILHIYEVFDIYENCEFPVLRKTKDFAWEILDTKIKRVRDDRNRLVFKLKD